MESLQPSAQEKEPNLFEAAEKLRSQYQETDELMLQIAVFIRKHSKTLETGGIKTQTILESRLTPAEEAFKKNIVSCGTMTTISAAMLRHIGFQVRFVHGECTQSVDHAWISVLKPETNEWQEYDLTRKDNDIPPTHIKKMEVENWEDMKDQLTSDYETMKERRLARGNLS
jgi:methionine synthase II (cobalamin-independent)